MTRVVAEILKTQQIERNTTNVGNARQSNFIDHHEE